MRRLHRLVPLALALAAPFAVLALVSAVIVASGFPIAPALKALVAGAVGSGDAFLSATAVRAVPLLLTGLEIGRASCRERVYVLV